MTTPKPSLDSKDALAEPLAEPARLGQARAWGAAEWGSAQWEMERQMDQAMHEAHEEMLAEKARLGALLLKGDEAGFEAALPSFAAMSWAELDGQAFAGSDRDDAYHEESLADICAERGLPRALAALLAAGARGDDESGFEGAQAIHRAAGSGSVACVEALLSHGRSVEALTQAGKTPLMTAARAGRPETVALLLSRGADAGFKNQGGLDAEAFAAAYGRHEVLAVLGAWREAQALRSEIGQPEPPAGGEQGGKPRL